MSKPETELEVCINIDHIYVKTWNWINGMYKYKIIFMSKPETELKVCININHIYVKTWNWIRGMYKYKSYLCQNLKQN